MHIFKVFADKGMQGCFSPFVFNVLFQTFLSWQEENYFPSGMLRSNEALKSIFFFKAVITRDFTGKDWFECAILTHAGNSLGSCLYVCMLVFK